MFLFLSSKYVSILLQLLQEMLHFLNQYPTGALSPLQQVLGTSCQEAHEHRPELHMIPDADLCSSTFVLGGFC